MRAVLILAILTFISCKFWKPKVKVIDTNSTFTTITERVKDTTIYIRSENAKTLMDSVGLFTILNQLKKGKDTVYLFSKNGAAVQKFYLDAEGNLNAECEASERKFTALLKEISILKNSSKESIVKEQNSWFIVKLVKIGLSFFVLVLAIGLPLFCGALILKRFKI